MRGSVGGANRVDEQQAPQAALLDGLCDPRYSPALKGSLLFPGMAANKVTAVHRRGGGAWRIFSGCSAPTWCRHQRTSVTLTHWFWRPAHKNSGLHLAVISQRLVRRLLNAADGFWPETCGARLCRSST